MKCKAGSFPARSHCLRFAACWESTTDANRQEKPDEHVGSGLRAAAGKPPPRAPGRTVFVTGGVVGLGTWAHYARFAPDGSRSHGEGGLAGFFLVAR